MPRESVTVAKIRRAIEQRWERAWMVKTHGRGYGRAGIPDLLVCWHGQFVAIEVKRTGEKPSAVQHHELAAIMRAGGLVCVMYEHDWEQALSTLTDLVLDRARLRR